MSKPVRACFRSFNHAVDPKSGYRKTFATALDILFLPGRDSTRGHARLAAVERFDETRRRRVCGLRPSPAMS
jgi:hypothetical protein